MRFYESDQAVLNRLTARRAQEQYRANASPTLDFAQRVELLQTMYPTISPSLAVSFAAARVDPTSPEVQAAIDMDVEKQAQDGGGFFDTIGDVLGNAKKIAAPVGALGRLADTALGDVDESILPAFKGAIRTGFVALETPLQEVQTIIRAGGYAGVRLAEEQGDTSILNRLRNIVDPTRWDDQAREFSQAYGDAGTSTGREALSDLLHGRKVDVGTGFLPGGGLAEEQRARSSRLTLKIGDAQFGGPGNPAISAGRVVAARVAEPGSTQFSMLSGLIDAGVAWFGDPVNAGLAKAADAQVGQRIGRAGRAFRDTGPGGLARAAEELATRPGFGPKVTRDLQSRAAEALGDRIHSMVGMVPSTRSTVQPVYTEQWLTKGGRRLVGKMVETTDFTDLYDATKGRLGVKLTRDLADASTEQDVMKILLPALGTQLESAPEFLGYRVGKYSSRSVRLRGEMPGAFIDPNNVDDGVRQLDNWLRNAKVSPELRREAMDTFARVGNVREELVTTLTDDIMPKVADELATKVKGTRSAPTPAVRAGARHLTRMWNQSMETTRAYFVDEIAENAHSAGVVINGQHFDAQSPWLFTEYLNSLVPLPDAREIRRATSKMSRIVDNPAFNMATDGLDWLMGGWKRVTLLRGAYTVRVIGEEQVRMAASGLDSTFAHPISFIAALMGDAKATRKLVEGSGVADDLGRRVLRGTDIKGEVMIADAMPEFDAAMNKGWAGWVDRTVFDKHHTIFKAGDDGYERAWMQGVGELSNDPIAREVAKGRDNLDDVKRWFWSEKGRGLRKRMVTAHPQLATQQGADAYVDLLWQGVKYRTGDDPLLMDAIATGIFDGRRIGKLNDKGVWHFDEGFTGYFQSGQVVGPEAIKGQRVIEAGRMSTFDNVTGFLFSHLNTKPTNFLSRSPTFRQKYWERIEGMLPYMDDATRDRVLASAEGVVDRQQIARMRRAGKATNQGSVEFDDFDTIAKSFALNETRKLLYDLSQKSQFFDAFRLIFPFGEAWKEVLGRWVSIGAQNPKVLRRGQQVMVGARGADLDGNGEGFFHKDVNGEEVFTYPFSRNISRFMTGVPVDFSGRVAGLSLMTEVLPGVGPVVQVPAAAIVPETPDWDWLKEIVAPYGDPDTDSGVLEAFLPGYARNLRQAFEKGDERLFGNAVGSAMDYLSSTGEYDTRNADPTIRARETQRLIDDATRVAKQTYLLRSVIQFGAPTSPLPEHLVKDKNDDLAVARVLIQDFYKLQQAPEDGGVGYDNAVGEFLDRYGADNFMLTQPKSYSVVASIPVNKKAAEWERANGDLVKAYDKVWGFFAPQDDVDSFDYQAYERQFARGDRVSLTPEQRMSLAQGRVGQYIYDRAKERVGDEPNASEREWLAVVKQRLREEYPGFGERTVGLPARANPEQLVQQLRLAVADPRLSSTRIAEAARTYIAARDKALAYAREIGVKTLEAQAAEPARAWLAQIGERLRQQYPEFGEMFDMVFSREVEA